MSRHLVLRSLAALAVSGLALTAAPRAASADQWDPGTSRPSNAGDPSKDKSDYHAVYDVSPAAAKAAFAQAQYDQTYANLIGVSSRVQSEFKASADYRTASKAVDDARAVYVEACEPVLENVHRDSAYNSLIERRTPLDIALRTGDGSQEGRLSVASQKMEISAMATRMETAALRKDAAVRQAKAKLDDAQAALATKQAQFDASLYSNPSLVEAKEAYETANANLAAARAYLGVALLARSDTIDADRRRYSGQIVNYVDPYYTGGYYGLGNGYYGSNLTTVRFTNP